MSATQASTPPSVSTGSGASDAPVSDVSDASGAGEPLSFAQATVTDNRRNSRRRMSVREVSPLADDPLVCGWWVLLRAVRRDETRAHEVGADLTVVVVEVDDLAL